MYPLPRIATCKSWPRRNPWPRRRKAARKTRSRLVCSSFFSVVFHASSQQANKAHHQDDLALHHAGPPACPAPPPRCPCLVDWHRDERSRVRRRGRWHCRSRGAHVAEGEVIILIPADLHRTSFRSRLVWLGLLALHRGGGVRASWKTAAFFAGPNLDPHIPCKALHF
jgi:hypothetical protein